MATRAGAVALLVVLAGCSLFGGGGATDSRTVTPAPVPSETTQRPTLPPGVTGAGVVDLDALIRAHVEAAAGTSYVWADRERRFHEGGQALVPFDRRIVVENGTTYYRKLDPRPMFVRGNYESPPDDQRFADGEWLYTLRRFPEGRVEYGVQPATDVSRRLARISGRAVRLYLAVPNATVSAVRVDGERHFEVVAHRDRYPLNLPLTAPVYNYSVRAVVSPAGLVERLNATYRTDRGELGVRVVYNYTMRDVGTATVDEPAWVAEARARVRPGENVTADAAG